MSAPIPEPVADLLRAVLDAIDIPHPATFGDSEQHARILNARVMHATLAIRDALDAGRPSLDIEWTTDYLRARLAENPPTGYRHAGVPRQDGAGR
ncbi:hypothetical protein [Streptomyces sp. RTd22]|uniref:hypothetical protein n=1 Tax=Streptomyces sp. RTd22 TaxID=1841249 RepID=UPI0007C53C02|nr:hypothetical protein [Streptomyces sp. RTd22]